jgi:hypothetical protein
VIIRNANGVGELLGQIHETELEAAAQAVYWLHYFRETVSAEWVAFEVPEKGTPVEDSRDVLKGQANG